MSVYLDTHITLSLYSGQTERLSKRASYLINRERDGAAVKILESMAGRGAAKLTIASRSAIFPDEI